MEVALFCSMGRSSDSILPNYSPTNQDFHDWWDYWKCHRAWGTLILILATPAFFKKYKTKQKHATKTYFWNSQNHNKSFLLGKMRPNPLAIFQLWSVQISKFRHIHLREFTILRVWESAGLEILKMRTFRTFETLKVWTFEVGNPLI